jgi:hypothetical protein
MTITNHSGHLVRYDGEHYGTPVTILNASGNDANTSGFGYESLTVSTAAVGPTVSVYAPTGEDPAEAVLISVESNGIRFRYDGGEPTSSEGHALAAGTTYLLAGVTNVAQLRLIRSGGADATVHLTYER